MYDVIVVGAGPAGLSAALVLGRCRRRVLVCDTGRPRNAASQRMHGYLTRDGIPPREFLRIAREQLEQYDTVELRDAEVVAAECVDGRFSVTLPDDERLVARKLLIATGVVDHVPEIPGFHELYGRSVFHCPYYDGWEVRDRPLAVYGRGARGFGLSLELTGWSRDLVLCTDGPSEIDAEGHLTLERNGIRVREERAHVAEQHAGFGEVRYLGDPAESFFEVHVSASSSRPVAASGCGPGHWPRPRTPSPCAVPSPGRRRPRRRSPRPPRPCAPG